MLLAYLASVVITQTAGPLPKTSFGRIVRLSEFEARAVPNRNIDVWLPAHYDGKRKFAVLYMQDGQDLFDKTLATDGQEWKVDETLTALHRQNRIRDTIVVGVWSRPESRLKEFFPNALLDALSSSDRKAIFSGVEAPVVMSDAYVSFLIDELKPFIDKKFRTEPAACYVSGAGLGAIVSLYAMFERPGTVLGAACLSPEWFGNDVVPKAMGAYVRARAPLSARHRVYFDRGDQGQDATNVSGQQMIDRVIHETWRPEGQWLSFEFPGDAYGAKAWSARLAMPMYFILQKS